MSSMMKNFLSVFAQKEEDQKVDVEVEKLSHFDKEFYGAMDTEELAIAVKQAKLDAERAKLFAKQLADFAKGDIEKTEDVEKKYDAPGRGQHERPIVAFVGASPSKIDFIRNRPFSGLVGKTMSDLYLKNLGLDESSVYMTNVVKEFCFDANRKPTDPSSEKMAEALPAFVEEMENVKPRFIVALGKTAKAVISEISEEWLPHPRAINMNTDSGEVERKMKRLAKKVSTPDHVLKGVIAKSGDDKQIVYGVVMEPFVNDTDNNWTTPDQIEEAAHLFMKSFRQIDTEHSREDISATPVENWIQHEDTIIGGQEVSAGSWVMGVKIEDPDEWAAIKDGAYTGFSIDAVTRINPTMLLK